MPAAPRALVEAQSKVLGRRETEARLGLRESRPLAELHRLPHRAGRELAIRDRPAPRASRGTSDHRRRRESGRDRRSRPRRDPGPGAESRPPSRWGRRGRARWSVVRVVWAPMAGGGPARRMPRRPPSGPGSAASPIRQARPGVGERSANTVRRRAAHAGTCGHAGFDRHDAEHVFVELVAEAAECVQAQRG